MSELDEIRSRAGILTERGARINRILSHIHNRGQFVMMSVFQPNYDLKQNRERTAKLVERLKNQGFGVIKMTGWWEDEKEDAVFATPRRRVEPGIMRRVAADLGNDYDQDAVVVGDGEEVVLLDKGGGVLETFDATTIRANDLKQLPGKSEIRGRQIGLIQKDDPRFPEGPGKAEINPGKEPEPRRYSKSDRRVA